MSKILCMWLREVCSCCSLTVLPGPDWVLLNYVLQRIFLSSVVREVAWILKYESMAETRQADVICGWTDIMLMRSSRELRRSTVLPHFHRLGNKQCPYSQ